MANKVLVENVRALLGATMSGLVAGNAVLASKAAIAPTSPDVRSWLEDLTSKQDTYRDGILALLAYPVAAKATLDVTLKTATPSGHRRAQLPLW